MSADDETFIEVLERVVANVAADSEFTESQTWAYIAQMAAQRCAETMGGDA